MHLPSNFQETLTNTRDALLAQRGTHGHWEGELSNSALSTAVAVCALAAFRKSNGCLPEEAPQIERLGESGLAWLATHQNEDGGWGDTVLSFSNISTTALCWGAFAGQDDRFPEVVRNCEAWLKQTVARSVGSATDALTPADLAEAIRRRYGKDHTFSVPILTTLALTGRLGSLPEAWRLVPQLPFELAAFPHAWYAKLKLPVVSYALPALIAIGQVRFAHRPGWNLPLVALRHAVRERTLRVLREIQPESGGYLEATPLTAFVTLSLIRANRAEHPVVRRGVDFLVRSVRPDGSWAIDSNLATWVTTLSTNALAAGDAKSPLSAEEQSQIRAWLLSQQYRTRHPYTHAAPGGWAWTDLPGGVPDADDTPGALLALSALDDGSEAVHSAAGNGVRWLLGLQNSDGGMPTFCRGWGTLPFDRSSADLTAHALRAWHRWQDRLPADLQRWVAIGTRRGVAYLTNVQRADGAWTPLWFGNQQLQQEESPLYGTSRVLLAAVDLSAEPVASPLVDSAQRGVQWLCDVQLPNGGWNGGEPDCGPASIEETALALEALAAALERPTFIADRRLKERAESALERGLAALIELTDRGRSFPASPIGFYFAKLWYFERLYPIVFALSALHRAKRLACGQHQAAVKEGVPR